MNYIDLKMHGAMIKKTCILLVGYFELILKHFLHNFNN